MTSDEKVIRAKLGLLELGKELGNVSRACKLLGYSRDSYYRLKRQFETGGTEAMAEISRRQPNYRNRFSAETEKAILELSLDEPTFGQKRIANELLIRKGVIVSSGGVRCVWMRHDLLRMEQRLAALEAKIAQSGGILTEAQKIALEEVRSQREAHGEFESEHPGYCGAQDTFLRRHA